MSDILEIIDFLNLVFQIKGRCTSWSFDLCINKSNKNIKGLNIFDHEFLYTAYVNNTTFFLKDRNLFFETLNIFHNFYLVSVLKPNTKECEITVIGTLKG